MLPSGFWRRVSHFTSDWAISSAFKELLATALEGLGAVQVRQGEPGQAARLWGAAEALRETIGATLHPVYRSEYEKAVAAACTELGKEAFAATWAEGQATPIEQIIEEVLITEG